MSIKIYNGYKLPNWNLQELYVFSKALRKEVRELSKKLATKKMAQKCIGFFDYMFLPDHHKELFPDIKDYIEKGNNKSGSALFLAYQKMMEHEFEIQVNHKKIPEYDFSFDLTVFPSKDGILAMLFAEHKAYVDMFKSIEGIELYPYWDNTDKPENITQEEWDKRRDEWLEAIGETGVPSLEGLTITCYTSLPFIEAKEVVDYINENISFETRVNSYANKIVLFQKFNELTKDSEQSYELYLEAVKHLQTEEGHTKVTLEKEVLSSLFKKEIVEEDLITSICTVPNHTQNCLMKKTDYEQNQNV